MSSLEIAFEEAKDILKGNLRGSGIIAGRQYYLDIWGRDAFISSLGMSISEDNDLKRIAKSTIDFLSKFQKEKGQLPNKVSPDGSKVCFGEGGCIDSSLWYALAVWAYYVNTNDYDFLIKHEEKVEKAIEWVRCLDQNGDFLIEINEGSDWMDLLIRSGRVLYDECLFYASLCTFDRIRKELGKEGKYFEFAEKVKESINIFFWPRNEHLDFILEKYGYTGIEADFKTALLKGKDKDYYLAEIRFRECDWRCDVYANILAIIFDIADKEKKQRILSYFDKEKLYEPYPIKVLWPPIKKEDPDWNLHFRWTNIPRLIEPGHYHNGGIWPYVGGFYVFTLIKEGMIAKAKEMLEKLAEANLKEGSEFNEWLNGNGIPSGSKWQSWSAGNYILAYIAYKKGWKEIKEIV